MIWWLPLALAAPVFFLWTVVHEGAHAVVAGVKVKSFKPWPHRVNGKWFFGRVVYEGKGTKVSTLAPYIVDLVVFPAFAVPLFFVGNDWAWSALITLAAAQPVNTATAVMGRLKLRDGSDLMKLHWAWSWAAFILVLAYVATGSAAIVVRFT